MLKENLMKESSTHTSIKPCVRIIQNGSLKALSSKNTSCDNLTTLSRINENGFIQKS